MLLEKSMSSPERTKFADKFLPITSDEEEALQNIKKTTRFSDDSDLEEYSVELPDGDSLNIVNSKSYIEFDQGFDSQEKLVSMFRFMAMNPDVDHICQNIYDDAMQINQAPDDDPIKLVINASRLTEVGYSEDFIKLVHESFREVLNLLDFRYKAWEYFKQFYVDAKIYCELVYEEGHTGIKSIHKLSPYNIVKVKHRGKYYYLYDETREKELIKKRLAPDELSASGALNGIPIVNYNYNDEALRYAKIKLIPEKYVVVTESSLKHEVTGYPLSPLVHAKKILNQYNVLKDSVVVYRVSRAPERRVLYVSVGKMRQSQVKAALKDISKEFKQNLVFDNSTGALLNSRSVFALTSDFVIPRYDNGQTTTLDTLKGGENLGEMRDVEFFGKELVKQLKVPLSRMYEDQAVVSLGNDSEFSRDEMRFNKYVRRLRDKFNDLLWETHKRQLLAKNIIALPSEYAAIKNNCRLVYALDNYFDELQRLEVEQNKVNLFMQYQPLIEDGTLSSIEVQRDILGRSLEDIEQSNEDQILYKAMKAVTMETMFEDDKKIAEMDGEIALLQSPELQIQIEDIKQNRELAEVKYQDSKSKPNGSN